MAIFYYILHTVWHMCICNSSNRKYIWKYTNTHNGIYYRAPLVAKRSENTLPLIGLIIGALFMLLLVIVPKHVLNLFFSNLRRKTSVFIASHWRTFFKSTYAFLWAIIPIDVHNFPPTKIYRNCWDSQTRVNFTGLLQYTIFDQITLHCRD